VPHILDFGPDAENVDHLAARGDFNLLLFELVQHLALFQLEVALGPLTAALHLYFDGVGLLVFDLNEQRPLHQVDLLRAELERDVFAGIAVNDSTGGIGVEWLEVHDARVLFHHHELLDANGVSV